MSEAHTAKTCCCYVIDSGYILPTLVSALQARSFVETDQGDIIIFCVGHQTATGASLQAICGDQGIQFHWVDPAAIDNLPIMYGRFFLHRLLKETYSSVLYIDGDTQVSGSLLPLLRAPLTGGRFLAARDPMSIVLKGRSQDGQRAYFKSIGLTDAGVSRYFNSGVMRFDIGDLEYISKAVIDMSTKHGLSFRFPDQDPLNLVFGSEYLTMSYKWNFPSFFLGAGFQSFIKPRVYHFMSNPRPWHGPFIPWGRAWSDPYAALVKRFPELAPFTIPIQRSRYLKYFLQQRYKHRFELPSWTTNEVRESIFAIERESYI